MPRAVTSDENRMMFLPSRKVSEARSRADYGCVGQGVATCGGCGRRALLRPAHIAPPSAALAHLALAAVDLHDVEAHAQRRRAAKQRGHESRLPRGREKDDDLGAGVGAHRVREHARERRRDGVRRRHEEFLLDL